MTDSLPPLVDADDLDKYPGAPFTDAQVKSASTSVRAEAQWHIAPEISETVTLDSHGSTLLLLPTMRLSKVDQINDLDDPDSPQELDGYRIARNGRLYRKPAWPVGFQRIEVEMTHGYDECPPELLPVIAARCEQAKVSAAVRQETTAGGESATYASAARSGDTDRRVQRYRIPTRP